MEVQHPSHVPKYNPRYYFCLLQRERPEVAEVADKVDLKQPTGFNSDSSSSGSSSSSSSECSTCESSDDETQSKSRKR